MRLQRLIFSALIFVTSCGVPEEQATPQTIGTAAGTGMSLKVQQAANPEPRLALAIQAGPEYLERMQRELGLGAEYGFQARTAYGDGMDHAHIRYDELYRGVKVWQGEVILHFGSEGTFRGSTNALRESIQISTVPSLNANEARAIVHHQLTAPNKTCRRRSGRR